MKRIILFSAAIMLALIALRGEASAQKLEETPKVEVGVQFSSLSVNQIDFNASRTEAGFGGRVTYNLTDRVAFEAEGNFFPRRNFSSSTVEGGRAVQGLFGVKAGKRFERFGIFGKARPGFIRYSNTITAVNVTSVTVGGEQFFLPDLQFGPKTHVMTDIGGVVEIYHSRRIATRFDIGDSLIYYAERTGAFFFAQPGAPPQIFTRERVLKNNFQFSAGVQFRF